MSKETDLMKAIFDGIASAKQMGQYHYEQSIPQTMRMKVVDTFREANYLILDHNGLLMFTWIGSRTWYQSQSNTTSYTKEKVMDKALDSLFEILGDTSSTVKFYYPQMDLKVSSKFDPITGNVKADCRNRQSVGNKLFNIISKFKG